MGLVPLSILSPSRLCGLTFNSNDNLLNIYSAKLIQHNFLLFIFSFYFSQSLPFCPLHNFCTLFGKQNAV